MRILFVSANFEKGKTIDLRKYDPEELLMLIDLDRCISCGACELACQIEHGDLNGMFGCFRPISVERKSGYGDNRILYLPLACRHCESPCDYYGPDNFWTTCPRGKEKGRNIISCDACIDRTQKGFWPACATRCSMKTIYFGSPQDIAFTLGEKGLREMGNVDISE
jgi:Fe-S-cluster-containing dehydrogenase component